MNILRCNRSTYQRHALNSKLSCEGTLGTNKTLLLIYIDLQDMKIEDQEIVELVKQIEEHEKKLFAHPLHKVFHITSNLAFRSIVSIRECTSI